MTAPYFWLGESATPKAPVEKFPAHLFERDAGYDDTRCRYCNILLENSDGVSPCACAPR